MGAILLQWEQFSFIQEVNEVQNMMKCSGLLGGIWSTSPEAGHHKLTYVYWCILEKILLGKTLLEIGDIVSHLKNIEVTINLVGYQVKTDCDFKLIPMRPRSKTNRMGVVKESPPMSSRILEDHNYPQNPEKTEMNWQVRKPLISKSDVINTNILITVSHSYIVSVWNRRCVHQAASHRNESMRAIQKPPPYIVSYSH